MINNYENQVNLSNEDLCHQYEHFSKFDSKIGVFNSFMLRNNKFYLIEYLNALIEGLLMAQKKYAVRHSDFNDE